MYQTIHEAITVAGVYEHGSFRPIKFRWKERLYVIEEIASVHDFRDGTIQKRRFSVKSGGTIYLIEFDRQHESWILEQLWVQ